MLYHALRTIYAIDPDYSQENWHAVSWDEAFDIIWRRLDRDYRTQDKVQEWFTFIQNHPNEVVIISGNLFQLVV